MRAVVLEEGDLHVLEGELRPQPEPHQILIAVKACVATVPEPKARQLFHALKHQIPVGHEVSGQVIQVGSKVTEFVVGDDVAAYLPLDHPASGLAEYVALSTCWACKKPPEISFHDCAAILRCGVQAYTALHYHLKVSRGDLILITRATFDGRQAFIELAHQWGARVLVTAYSREEVHALQDIVNESQIVDLSGGASLTRSIMELSGGLGVDCVIDGGEILSKATSESPSKHEVISSLAARGMWISMVPDLQIDPPDSQLLYWKGASLCFLNDQIWNLSGAQQGRFLHVLFDLLCKVREGSITPRIAQKISFSAIRLDDCMPQSGGRKVVVFDMAELGI